MRIAYSCLRIFSSFGGIESFNRNFLMALGEIAQEEGHGLCALSLHDRDVDVDTRYLVATPFSAFGGDRAGFISNLARMARRTDVLVVAHVNLAPIALLCKALNPRLRLVTLAYGIDVWNPVTRPRRLLLKLSHSILAISRHTRAQMASDQALSPDRISVLPVMLDRHGYREDAPAAGPPDPPGRGRPRSILTVCRLSSEERYKGYDRVVRALPGVRREFPAVRYTIAGRTDPDEEARLRAIIAEHGLDDCVELRGFVSDEELARLYTECDVFVMPSTNEGFGIVFLEAMRMGRPVIAGNRDGSVDALDGGRLGLLVDPLDVGQIEAALRNVLARRAEPRLLDPDYLRREAYAMFGYPAFKERLRERLKPITARRQRQA